MSASDTVYRAEPDPGGVSALKRVTVRLALAIVICGIIALGLHTTIAGGLKLAADQPRLASVTTDAASDEAEPAAPSRLFTAPAHGPADARHEAAAAMLLLLVATAQSRRARGDDAQRQAAAAKQKGRPVSNQTADAGQVR
jgi:hypothetical protein